MFNYANGKRIASVGLALSLLIVILDYAVPFLANILDIGYNSFFDDISGFSGWALLVIPCIPAIGFGIMWLSNRRILDFAIAAIFVLLPFCHWFHGRETGFLVLSLLWDDIFMGYDHLVNGALSVALYLLLAIRVKDKNRILFLLFGCAVLFRIVLTVFYIFIPNIFPYEFVPFIFLIIAAGNIICEGLCFLSTIQD